MKQNTNAIGEGVKEEKDRVKHDASGATAAREGGQ